MPPWVTGGRMPPGMSPIFNLAGINGGGGALTIETHEVIDTSGVVVDTSQEIFQFASLDLTQGDLIISSIYMEGTKQTGAGDIYFITEYQSGDNIIDWIANKTSVTDALHNIQASEVVRYANTVMGLVTADGTVTIRVRGISNGGNLNLNANASQWLLVRIN